MLVTYLSLYSLLIIPIFLQSMYFAIYLELFLLVCFFVSTVLLLCPRLLILTRIGLVTLLIDGLLLLCPCLLIMTRIGLVTSLLSFFGSVNFPPILMCDNQSAIQLARVLFARILISVWFIVLLSLII